MQPANNNRPLEGAALEELLQDLAEINVTAMSLKYDLEPITEEDKALGVEPLTPTEIAQELDHIATIVTRIAMHQLKATADEWVEANDQIE